MKPYVSVVLPSRGRVAALRRMAESLFRTATDPQGVELIVRCDRDDDETLQYLRQAGDFTFIVGSRINGYSSIATFINEAARLSHADLVLVVNDDAEFITRGWDTALREVASAYPDGIFDLGVTTIMNDSHFVFPCTSRRVINLIGVHDERLIYNDIWLRDVMSPFGRAIRVPDVVIKHVWEGMTPDQQQALRIVQNGAYAQLYARCVQEGQQKIQEALAWSTCVSPS